MRYRRLGRSGLQVSPLCLGAMMFGAQTDESTSQRIIDRARDAGVNFIDTADAYAGGASEEIVGRAVCGHRSWWVVATKLANPTGPGPNARGLSRRHMFEAVDASLRRLGLETVDIVYFHKEDPATSFAEMAHAMADLVRSGRVRHFGVSNHRAWRVAELCRACDAAGIDRPVVSQPLYNALNRQAEVEHLPACAHLGLGVVPYSPLARGVLTGKYHPDAAPPPGSRAGRQDRRIMEVEWRPESLRIAAELAERARSKGATPGQFALAWVLTNRLVAGAIAGPRTQEHWEEYLGAVDVTLDGEDEALVDRLVPPGHASTHGFVDPSYPVEGRLTAPGGR
ncbi:MAG: aldo/keto reductase [Acetobacteraceae bacterium]|nr:aldo/keto reductase [Acetobacteraceae bacterium]